MDVPHLTNLEKPGAVAATALTAFAIYDCLPEAKPALATVTDKLGVDVFAKSAAPSLADFQVSMASKGLSATDLSGGIAGVSEKVPTYASLKAAMVQKGLTAEDLLAAESKRNFINSGWDASVYRIPKLPDFVMRIPHNVELPDIAKLEPVSDPAPQINFGQPVAKVGPAEIIKKVPGEPYGPTNMNSLTKQQIADIHAEHATIVASMPQSAYDGLATTLKQAETNGLSFDSNNANNILFDRKRNLLGAVDFSRVAPGERAPASLNDMLYTLAESPRAGLPPPTGWVPAEGAHAIEAPGYLRWMGEPDPMQSQYRQIVDKSFAAAKKAGLRMYQTSSMNDIMRNAGISSSQYRAMLDQLNR